jgi:hypothetical protein
VITYAKYISWQKLQGVVFIIDERNEKIYSLEDISSEIWLLINKGFSNFDITVELLKKYKVDFDQLLNDVNEFIDELLLIEVIKVGSC